MCAKDDNISHAMPEEPSSSTAEKRHQHPYFEFGRVLNPEHTVGCLSDLEEVKNISWRYLSHR